jgi:site-specific DNA-cytosine methylase
MLPAVAKPLVIDLFCGLGGWSEAFLAEGYRAVGFDIERHDYGNGGYPGELVLRDIRSLNGKELVREFGIPAVIVGSPPCQEFSYMEMPWSKAKEKMRKIHGDPAERKRLCDLFYQCFRVQREVLAVCGHHVPMVVENVRGAQRWVGKARWNFGSFYLWGDVPALMPIPGKIRKTPEGSWDTTRKNYNADHSWEKGEGNKTAGMNWSDREKKGQDFTRIAGQQSEGTKLASETGRRTDPGKGARFTTRDCGNEGNKQFKAFHDSPIAALGSKFNARKQASAEIAKIPPALAQWIARTFKPVEKIS